MLASKDLEATDPKFDDIKILTRSQEGYLITIPIKVSIMMNISIFNSHLCLIKIIRKLVT